MTTHVVHATTYEVRNSAHAIISIIGKIKKMFTLTISFNDGKGLSRHNIEIKDALG